MPLRCCENKTKADLLQNIGLAHGSCNLPVVFQAPCPQHASQDMHAMEALDLYNVRESIRYYVKPKHAWSLADPGGGGNPAMAPS